eukprot:EG_transcript_57176
MYICTYELCMCVCVCVPVVACAYSQHITAHLCTHPYVRLCTQRVTCGAPLWGSPPPSQASNNYVACISIEEAQLANRMNILLGRLTLLTVVFIPFNLFAGLFGMNV